MFTEPMHGPVAVSIFWMWLGFIAVGALAYLVYRLLRPRLNKVKEPPPAPPMKYAEQLRQRMQKKPSPPGSVSPDSEGKAAKTPPRTR